MILKYVTPLGLIEKKHKLTAIYYTILNLYPWNRTKDENMQLVLLVKANIFYKSSQKILTHVTDELKKLEDKKVDIKGKSFSVKLFGIAGDNLGSNFIGGFICSFRLGSPCCRVCTSEVNVLECYNRYELRDEESFNTCMNNVEADDDLRHCNGIKMEVPFNNLKEFHSTTSLPPCCAHDLLQGIIRSDFIVYLNYFCKNKKYFNLDFLNRRIDSFKFKGRDNTVRPSHVEHGKPLNGSASQIWCFLRFLPVFLSGKVNENDEVWQIVLLLRQVCELIFALSLTEKQVSVMNNKIWEYLHQRRQVFPQESFKPKHHFIEHYAYHTLMFGPLLYTCTLRFEAKHQFFKNAIRSMHNFISVTKALAEKHELRQAVLRCANTELNYPGCLETFNPCSYPQGHLMLEALKKHSALNLLCTFHTTSVIEWRGFTYKNGIIVNARINFVNVYCSISLIVVAGPRNSDVFVVLRTLETCEVNGVLYITRKNELTCKKLEELNDPYPLELYGSKNDQYIVLKHVSPCFS